MRFRYGLGTVKALQICQEQASNSINTQPLTSRLHLCSQHTKCIHSYFFKCCDMSQRLDNIIHYFQLIHLSMGLRMDWSDLRIIVNQTEDTVYLYRDQRHNFWLPDLFLINSVDVKVSKLILDPIVFKIFKDGSVEFSIREEVQAVCPMNMINYPVSASKRNTFTRQN